MSETERDMLNYDWSNEIEREELLKTINGMISRYSSAKNAEIGATIQCAGCGRLIIKTTYHKKFCRGSKCKDKYWNLVDDNRRKRMLFKVDIYEDPLEYNE